MLFEHSSDRRPTQERGQLKEQMFVDELIKILPTSKCVKERLGVACIMCNQVQSINRYKVH